MGFLSDEELKQLIPAKIALSSYCIAKGLVRRSCNPKTPQCQGK